MWVADGKTPQCCNVTSGQPLNPEYLHPFCLPIDIPADDSFYQQYGQTCMTFVRTQVGADYSCSLGHAEQVDALKRSQKWFIQCLYFGYSWMATLIGWTARWFMAARHLNWTVYDLAEVVNLKTRLVVAWNCYLSGLAAQMLLAITLVTFIKLFPYFLNDWIFIFGQVTLGLRRILNWPLYTLWWCANITASLERCHNLILYGVMRSFFRRLDVSLLLNCSTLPTLNTCLPCWVCQHADYFSLQAFEFVRVLNVYTRNSIQQASRPCGTIS